MILERDMHKPSSDFLLGTLDITLAQPCTTVSVPARIGYRSYAQLTDYGWWVRGVVVIEEETTLDQQWVFPATGRAEGPARPGHYSADLCHANGSGWAEFQVDATGVVTFIQGYLYTTGLNYTQLAIRCALDNLVVIE